MSDGATVPQPPGTPTASAPSASPASPSAGASPAWRAESLRLGLGTLRGGALGAMLLLGFLGACVFYEYSAGYSFVQWAGQQGHGILRKPGQRSLRKSYGENWEYEISFMAKANRVVSRLFLIGFGLGAVVGLGLGVAGVLRRRRAGASSGAGDAEAKPGLPWMLPLGLAVIGLVYHGFLWANVAVWTLPQTRRRRWVTVATWCVAILAVLVWSWGLEIEWEEGWSKAIPYWLKRFLYWTGHLFGMKE